MSSIYVLEPPTKGKVVMNTTMGPIDIELWPKEAPKAVRNFVQLAMEGYYDNTIFHRIIKSFLVQGGDPTGSGTVPLGSLRCQAGRTLGPLGHLPAGADSCQGDEILLHQ